MVSSTKDQDKDSSYRAYTPASSRLDAGAKDKDKEKDKDKDKAKDKVINWLAGTSRDFERRIAHLEKQLAEALLFVGARYSSDPATEPYDLVGAWRPLRLDAAEFVPAHAAEPLAEPVFVAVPKEDGAIDNFEVGSNAEAGEGPEADEPNFEAELYAEVVTEEPADARDLEPDPNSNSMDSMSSRDGDSDIDALDTAGSDLLNDNWTTTEAQSPEQARRAELQKNLRETLAGSQVADCTSWTPEDRILTNLGVAIVRTIDICRPDIPLSREELARQVATVLAEEEPYIALGKFPKDEDGQRRYLKFLAERVLTGCA